MRQWDINSAPAKLAEGLDTLRRVRREVGESWNDETHRRFEEEYLAAMEASLRRALDGIHRLSEVLAEAERECGGY